MSEVKPESASILIADDDHALALMLIEYLSLSGFHVRHAKDGGKALSMLQATPFQLLLLDVMMPVMDGFEVLRQLRQHSDIPVIMLTARGDDYDKVVGLEMGADDYLPKPFNHRELLARVKAILRRTHASTVQGNELPLDVAGIHIYPLQRAVRVDNKNIMMTATEFDVLHLLMKSAGQVVSKAVLSESVLGRKLTAYDRSIDMHVSNLRQKLANVGVVEVISTVRGQGYLFKVLPV